MGVMDVINTMNTLNNDTAHVNYQQSRSSLGSDKLGKDAFFRLLLAQLQNQDPMEPVDNAQFISQQAQFTQIEKLDALNETLTKSNLLGQASSMVGKTIQYTDEFGLTKVGRVDSVTIGDGSLGLQVNDEIVSTAQIQKIFAEGG